MPKTKSQIDDMQKQITSLDESWKRALADYQNLLRRVENDKKEFSKMANANLIARLIPSLDMLQLAADHNPDIGVQMAVKHFRQALTEEGLQTIAPQLDEPFDHNYHECTETIELTDGHKNNTISEVILQGYRLGDYVLRPARVKVYNHE
jgi:molecular chaperone GrpE